MADLGLNRDQCRCPSRPAYSRAPQSDGDGYVFTSRNRALGARAGTHEAQAVRRYLGPGSRLRRVWDDNKYMMTTKYMWRFFSLLRQILRPFRPDTVLERLAGAGHFRKRLLAAPGNAGV